MVCLALGTADPFLVCNPLTGESVILPEFDYSEFPRDISASTNLPSRCLASGFGYCPSTNEYKVVAILSMGEQKGHARVYTVGSGWRCMGFDGHYAANSFNYSPGIYANGALYWLHHSTKVQESKIVAFDLEDEKVHCITLPPSKDFEYEKSCSPLKLFGGKNNLYLVHQYHAASRIDIWVYEKINMNSGTSCPTKEFSIPISIRVNPFAITRSSEVLWSFGPKIHNCYDPKTSTKKTLLDSKAYGAECVHIKAITHVQSIVSLKDLGETDIISLKDSGLATEAQNEGSRIGTRGAKRKLNC